MTDNYTRKSTRLLAVMLTLVLLVGLMPSMALATQTQSEFGCVTKDDIFFRQSPSTSGSYWERLPEGWVMEILGTTVRSGITWYRVEGGVPSAPNKTYDGYIHGDFFRKLTAEETTTWLNNPVQGTISGGTTSTQVGQFVRNTAGGTNLRSRASASAASVASLPANAVLAVISHDNGWYYVQYTDDFGYVPDSAVAVMTQTEIDAYLNSGATTGTTTAQVYTTGGTLTLRKTQSTSAQGIAYIPHLTIINVLESEGRWTKAVYNGLTGYVLTSYLRFDGTVTAAPEVSPTAGTTVTATVKTTGGTLTLRQTRSTGATALTVIPNNTLLTILERGDTWCQTTYGGYTGYVLTSYLVFDSSASSYSSYIFITASSVNVRNAAGTSGKTVTQVNKNTVWGLTGTPVYNNSYLWYPIYANGRSGYVRGDCAIQMTKEQADAYFANGTRPGPTPTPDPNANKPSNYIIVSGSDALNVRAAASTSSKSLGKLKRNTVLAYTGTTQVGSTLWYRVNYEGVSSFVMGSYVRVMTQAEYNAYIGTQPTATPTPLPTAVPDLTQMSDLAYTIKDKIFVRKSGASNATSVTKVEKANTYFTLTGKSKWEGTTYIWYEIVYNKITGWIRGDLIHILTPAEKVEYEGANATPTPGTSEYVKYSTLKLGMTGTAVRNMQQELAKQGFLNEALVTGSFLASTRTAVIAFQAANNLTQDGLAGQKTLATLYGTPLYDNTSVDTTLYPVEKIDWYTGGIQSIWSRGSTAVITDVRTGLSFKARRWAGAKHADVEPLTAQDTAVMCKIYGVSNAQAISDRNLYQRRPLWVTIGKRTFCASMYGVPHNYPDGDTIANNDFNGQFCVHFTNSRTHGTDNVDKDHQAAIDYAYTHADSRK